MKTAPDVTSQERFFVPCEALVYFRQSGGAPAAGGEHSEPTEEAVNMRSLFGLLAVVTVASLYLYSLSLHLPAGPRRRAVPSAHAHGEHLDTADESAHNTEEPSR